MKNPPLIFANWKMKLTPKSSVDFAYSFVSIMKQYRPGKRSPTFVLCPSFENLSAVGAVIKKTSLALCAQDCFWEKEGAYTGEVSPRALKNIGCSYVLIGHSERRILCAETEAMIAKKVAAVLATPGLLPVLCIGESLEIRRANNSDVWLKKQLDACLVRVPRDKRIRLVIAYEPLWAISTLGTGLPIGPKDCAEVYRSIGQQVKRMLPKARIHVIYGGSVTSKNISSYLSYGISDGVLIGGASVKRGEMKKICDYLFRL